MKRFVALILLLNTGWLGAQTDMLRRQQRIDSLNWQLHYDSLHTYRFKQLRPYGNIDNRPSFLRNRPSNFSGYQLGVIVNEHHTFGLGFYQLNTATRRNSPVKAGYQLRNLRYTTVFCEFKLLNKTYYQVNLPFEVGYGTYRALYTDTLRFIYQNPVRPSFLPLSAGIKIIGKPVRWVGLSIMVGYRYFIQEETILEFNSLFFPIGVWIDLRQVYRDIKYYGFQKKRYRRALKEIMNK